MQTKWKRKSHKSYTQMCNVFFSVWPVLGHTETLLFRLITPPHLGQICSFLTTTRRSPSPGFSCAGAPATDSCCWVLRASCWSIDGIDRLSTSWRLMRRTEASTLAANVLPRWSSSTSRRARCSLASPDTEADRHRLSTLVPWKRRRRLSYSLALDAYG